MPSFEPFPSEIHSGGTPYLRLITALSAKPLPSLPMAQNWKASPA